MDEFELVLKKERLKQYEVFALLIILANAVFFAILAFSSLIHSVRYKSLAALLLILLSIATGKFNIRLHPKYNSVAAALLWIVFFYLLLGFWWLAFATAALTFLYFVSIRPLIVYVQADHISYPSFPKRIIHWNELNNILVKDGLLTIDFRTNRLAQLTVINGGKDYSLNEPEFNDFCKRQLNKAGGKTV